MRVGRGAAAVGPCDGAHATCFFWLAVIINRRRICLLFVVLVSIWIYMVRIFLQRGVFCAGLGLVEMVSVV